MRTDRHDEAFRNFANAPKNEMRPSIKFNENVPSTLILCLKRFIADGRMIPLKRTSRKKDGKMWTGFSFL
jgi:hypothetical protein